MSKRRVIGLALSLLILGFGIFRPALAQGPCGGCSAPAPCAPCYTYEQVEKTVMRPTMVTETRKISVVECRSEQRQRTFTVNRCVPELQTISENFTVMVPERRTRTETYNVCKPVMSTVNQTYTVSVPYQEQRQATRRVCKLTPTTETRMAMVPETRTRTETFPVCRVVMEAQTRAYTVNVPYQEQRQATRRVCHWTQVSEPRTIRVDRGHYETVAPQPCAPQPCAPQPCAPPPCAAPCAPPGCAMGPMGPSFGGPACIMNCCFRRRCCGPYAGPGCGMPMGCGGPVGCGAPAACAPAPCPQQVWVPNIVEEQVTVSVCKPVVVEEPYTYTVTLCRQEQRTCTVNVPRMVQETVSREVPYTVCVAKPYTVCVNRPTFVDVPYTYTVTLCRPETRTRAVQVCKYVTEQQTREVPYVVCVPKQETRSRQVTVMKYVPESHTENYTVQVPHTVEKEVQVQVCRMVPQKIKVWERRAVAPMAPSCTTPVPGCTGTEKKAPALAAK